LTSFDFQCPALWQEDATVILVTGVARWLFNSRKGIGHGFNEYSGGGFNSFLAVDFSGGTNE